MATATMTRLCLASKPNNTLLTRTLSPFPSHYTSNRPMGSSAQYVASRFKDHTFEKLMSHYSNLLKVVAIQDLILANPSASPSVSLDFLSRISQKLHLNRGPAFFLRKYPRIFRIFHHPTLHRPFCDLTPAASHLSALEADLIRASLPVTVHRLVRLLSMSPSRSLPLRAVFKVWRELGLPDDFEDSVLSQNPRLFQLHPAHEPNTHILKLVPDHAPGHPRFAASVEYWRASKTESRCGVGWVDGEKADSMEIAFGFKLQYPPGMKLGKNYKSKVKEWQRLPYPGPYDEIGPNSSTRNGMMRLKKRAVGIFHEFLSLTVEKMIEVEKISQFRQWFDIDFNVRDLFLDHPGIFYLSAKKKKHTIFLREAYERGCLIDPDPVYQVRRELLHLVMLGRRGFFAAQSKPDVCMGQDTGLKQEDTDA